MINIQKKLSPSKDKISRIVQISIICGVGILGILKVCETYVISQNVHSILLMTALFLQIVTSFAIRREKDLIPKIISVSINTLLVFTEFKLVSWEVFVYMLLISFLLSVLISIPYLKYLTSE